MRHKVRKVFLIWEHEKEEKWLNEMSAKGWQLVAVGYCTYYFEKKTPGEYTYRLELLENRPTHPESLDYINFLEETGIEFIGSYMRWAYFRKKNDGVDFQLYSDSNSRLKHYKRIMALLLAVAFINLMGLFTNAYYYLTSSLVPNFVAMLLSLLFFVLFLVGGYKLGKQMSALKKEMLIKE